VTISTPSLTDKVFEQYEQSVMGTYGRFPIALERGRGARVWDVDGREYLDFVAGIATCALGHSHPALTKAVTEQMDKLVHVSNLYYIPNQGELAQWITERSVADQVFFCNSGAEANEGAIKLARKYGHRVLGIKTPKILTAHKSFHGRTLATVTATGQPKYQKDFKPLVQGFIYAHYNDFRSVECAVRSNPDTVAILLEPLQGEGGVTPGDRVFFQQVRKLCTEKKILLILDEVQVGMGRTGKLWGYENLGIEPDVFTLAKALGGGVPIGALCARKEFALFEPGDHASTFGGNPLATAAGLAVCRTLEQENLVEQARVRGIQLRSQLEALQTQFPEHIEQVRGWGLIQGLVLKSISAIDVVKCALDKGLLLVPAGPQVVRFVPPLVVTAEEVDQAMGILRECLAGLCLAR
jgi:acetylornithine/N-succinyldiaminopimelate aminotransferase